MNWNPYLVALPMALFVIFAIYLKVVGGSIERTSEEVDDFFRRMAAGEVDDAGWDRFLNIPIKDKQLDGLRKRCEVLWENDEYLRQNSDGDYILTARGIGELNGLIHELRQIGT